MTATIEVGSVVRLKSGGPDMTVVELKTSLTGRQLARCLGFSSAGQFDVTTPISTLDLASAHDPAESVPNDRQTTVTIEQMKREF